MVIPQSISSPDVTLRRTRVQRTIAHSRANSSARCHGPDPSCRRVNYGLRRIAGSEDPSHLASQSSLIATQPRPGSHPRLGWDRGEELATGLKRAVTTVMCKWSCAKGGNTEANRRGRKGEVTQGGKHKEKIWRTTSRWTDVVQLPAPWNEIRTRRNTTPKLPSCATRLVGPSRSAASHRVSQLPPGSGQLLRVRDPLPSQRGGDTGGNSKRIIFLLVLRRTEGQPPTKGRPPVFSQNNPRHVLSLSSCPETSLLVVSCHRSTKDLPCTGPSTRVSLHRLRHPGSAYRRGRGDPRTGKPCNMPRRDRTTRSFAPATPVRGTKLELEPTSTSQLQRPSYHSSCCAPLSVCRYACCARLLPPCPGFGANSNLGLGHISGLGLGTWGFGRSRGRRPNKAQRRHG